jgi:hypothetical protein
MSSHRRIGWIATAAIVVALAACGDDGATEVATDRQPSDGGTSVAGDAQQVECGGVSFDGTELSDAPSVSSLAQGPAGAVDDMGRPAFDPSQDWKVVSVSDRHVALVRALERPLDAGGGDLRTHEARGLSLITGASNVPDGWMLTSAGECTPRLVTDGGLEAADLTLADPPMPADTSIDLLVQERDCASGEPADGRIEVIELVETADQVRLRVGVRPRGGDQTCPSNPPTPFTVELIAPLGDRAIVDSSIVPPRPVPVGGG